MVSDLIKMAQIQMTDAGIEDCRNDAEALYCHLKHVDRARFFMQWSEPADDLTCENYFRLVARRCKHEPLQLIIGEQEFLGLPMKVELGVLIPRLDTEVVALAAELLIKEHGYRTLLDLCCGTGAIGLALGKRTGIKATLSDISDKAVALARENAIINAVKADVVQGDLFEPLARKRFDIIVCNPPYIKTAEIPTLMPEVRQYEPFAALNGGEDGLDFYRRIVKEAPAYLKRDGALVLEIGADQAFYVTEMLENEPAFTEIHLMKDLAHNDRVVTALYDEKALKAHHKALALEARQAKREAKLAARAARRGENVPEQATPEEATSASKEEEA